MPMSITHSGLRILLAGALALAPVAGCSQEGPTGVPRVTVAQSRTQAINYRYLAGSTRIGFQGTVLLPRAEGAAKIRIHSGETMIRCVFRQLEPAARFGPGFQTYVLWAITPAGQTSNLGEVNPKPNGKAALDARSSLQTFGLFVTAEPHFAVSAPGRARVLENVLGPANPHKAEIVPAEYPLLPAPSCSVEGNPATFKASPPDPKVSRYVAQARGAMGLAAEAQAERFAPELYRRAELTQAKLEAEPKLWKKPAILLARQLVQQAEDARQVAIRNHEAQQRAEERAALERDRALAKAEAARAAEEREKTAEAAQRAQSQAARQAAREASATTRAQARRQLSSQLRALLQTQESDKGLVVRVPHPLFAPGKAELLAPAREKLAKVAGILLAYPGLAIKVEGHTDSTGRPDFNQELSFQRAENVRSYLHLQGIPPQTTRAVGCGAGQPLTSNATAAGRQRNRRVELIVSGDPIGI